MEDRSRLQVKTPVELYGLEGENPEVISRREVIRRGGTSPAWSFAGTDPVTGKVRTDASGHILEPAQVHILVGFTDEPWLP